VSAAAGPRREDAVLELHVVPRASRNAVEPYADNMWKVHLKAPPVDGKANQALSKYLASRLGCGARQVEVLSGLTARHKRVRVGGISTAEAASRLKSMGTSHR